jgi:hypothetical protein
MWNPTKKNMARFFSCLILIGIAVMVTGCQEQCSDQCRDDGCCTVVYVVPESCVQQGHLTALIDGAEKKEVIHPTPIETPPKNSSWTQLYKMVTLIPKVITHCMNGTMPLLTAIVHLFVALVTLFTTVVISCERKTLLIAAAASCCTALVIAIITFSRMKHTTIHQQPKEHQIQQQPQHCPSPKPIVIGTSTGKW